MLQILALLWLTCGFIAAGICNASTQREFPSLAQRDKWKDWHMSVWLCMFGGPIMLLVILLVDGIKHGWSLKPGCGVEDEQ